MASTSPPDVALIGYQDQGNLGMGYLAAVLRRHGRTVEMIDVRDGPAKIVGQLAARQPLMVGFSLSESRSATSARAGVSITLPACK
jgi:anaerobic magnesium-protoporphyrin IX monomethyl ester cyclase